MEQTQNTKKIMMEWTNSTIETQYDTKTMYSAKLYQLKVNNKSNKVDLFPKREVSLKINVSISFCKIHNVCFTSHSM